MGLPTEIALGIAASLVLAVLLEAGTLAGCLMRRVGDLACWNPLRMLVFLCVLVLPVTRAVRRVLSGTLPSCGLTARGVLVTLCCVVAGCVAGLAAGIPVAALAGDSGDMRYGLALAAPLVAGLLLFGHRHLVLDASEWAFLALALPFGCVFALLMPTASEISWDGATHFRNANGLSFVFDAEYTGADQMMCIGGLEGALYLTGDLSYTDEHSVELDSRIVQFVHADLEDEVLLPSMEVLREAERTGVVEVMEGTRSYPSGSFWSFRSLGLIPNAVGLWLGRLFGLDCIGRYLLARLSGVAFYVMVLFVAVRRLRHGKLIMSAIGLAPTSLMMAANFSYDPWTIALVSLSVATFVGTLQRRGHVTLSDTLAMCVPFVLGALVKAVLFPVGLVFCLIPAARFRSRRERVCHLLVCGASILFLIASFALPYVLPQGDADAGSDARGGSDVSVSRQIAYVLAHPAETLAMSVRFAAGLLDPRVLGFGLGVSDENMLYYFPYLVASTAPLNEAIAGAEYLLLLALSLTDGGPADMRFRQVRYKVGTLLACLFAFALVSGALYASFTDVGRDTISGVQYRYLLPLLAPLCLILPNASLRRRSRGDWYVCVAVICELVLLALVTFNSFVVLM